MGVPASVCRTGMRNSYLAQKPQVLHAKGLCLLIKLTKSVKISSIEVLRSILLGL